MRSIECAVGGNRAMGAGLFLLSIFASLSAAAEEVLPAALQEMLRNSPHTQSVTEAALQVKDYQLPLGAPRKISGSWTFKNSERVSGMRYSSSWQVSDGFSSREVLEDVVGNIEASGSGVLRFSCDGRACGSGSQWANRVFGERILYGREDLQSYRVYFIEHEAAEYWVLLYAAARTADRQYLRFDWIEVGPQ